MINKIKYVFIVLIFIITSNSHSQNQIIPIPEIGSPEQEFLSVFQKEKFENPIFLNGSIKEIHKGITEYITPNRKVLVKKIYNYLLNKNKQVVKYASDIEFDAITAELLNAQKTIDIKIDTIINHDKISYTFKQGKLLTKKFKTLKENRFDGFTDSIHFNYKKNKLTEIKEYKREIIAEPSDFEEEEELLISEDYFMTNYSEANYNKKKLLKSKLEINYDQNSTATFVDYINYEYDRDNKLTSYKKISKGYEIELSDLTNYIKSIKKNKLNYDPFETKESNGLYNYIQGNKIIKLNSLSTKEDKYEIEFSKEKTIIKYSNNGILERRFQYLFDGSGNPIEEKIFIYFKGIEYLDTSTILEIIYH